MSVTVSESTVKMLLSCRLFEGMGQASVSAVLETLGASEKRRAKGEYFLREGDPAGKVGILLSGSAQIVRDDYDGRCSVLADLRAGDTFGEVFACAGVQEYPVSVVADRESTALFADFRELLADHPHPTSSEHRLVQNLLLVTARKNLLLNRKIELLSKRTTREKLASFLYAKAKESKSDHFTIPFDRQALADYLGVERSAMCSELGRMRRDGLIDFHKNEFWLSPTGFPEERTV